MVTNHSVPGLNRGLSSNFCWLRSANHVKFTEECFSEKVFYKWAKHGFATMNLNGKDSSRSGNTLTPQKRKNSMGHRQ